MRFPRTSVAASIGLLVACVDPQDQTPSGTLVVAQELASTWVRNFNPLLSVGSVRVAARACMYEPLAIYNTLSGEWEGRLAESFQWSEDRLRLEFRIREGVLWSDGTAFSGEDVRYTFELLRSHPALDSHGVWSFLSSVQTNDTGEVEFAFRDRFVPGLTAIAQQAIVPKHVFSLVEDVEGFMNEEPVGTGPFTEVLRWDKQVWDLGKNPHYWQEGKPLVEALRFPAFPDNEQANTALVRGELDWAGTFVPAVERIFVERNPEHHHYWFPQISSTIFLYANHLDEHLSDVRVREAISRGVDRDRIARIGMYNTTVPASPTGLSKAHDRWEDRELAEESTWTTHSPQRAGALLKEAGFVRGQEAWLSPKGEAVEWEIIVPAGWSDWVRSSQVIAQDLREIGLRVRVKTLDFGAWLHAVQNGDFELAMGWAQRGPTPYEMFQGLMGSQDFKPAGEISVSNWHRFKHSNADLLLQQLEATADPEGQASLFVGLQRLFESQKPAIPLFPGPVWGSYNTSRFTGFPSAENPRSILPPNRPPESLITMAELRSR